MLNGSPWRPTTSVQHCWQLIEARSPLLSPHTERRNSVLWSLPTRALTPPEQGSPFQPHLTTSAPKTIILEERGFNMWILKDHKSDYHRPQSSFPWRNSGPKTVSDTEPGKLHWHFSMYPAALITDNLSNG